MTHACPQSAFRFAPSPNGYLHLGHAFSALENERLARLNGGRLFLRIENIDVDRCRPEYERAILEDLTWLGIALEPEVRRQSEHFDDYAQALDRLARMGLIYPCFCSRTDIMQKIRERAFWARDPDGSPLYPGTCKHLPKDKIQERLEAGEPASYRLDMGKALNLIGYRLGWTEFGSGMVGRFVQASPQKWGDTILARKDIATSYHIAVVVDDALQRITDIVRGEDLFQATSLHRLLQSLLGLPEPAYHHHGLLRDASGQKLSKSLRAKSLRALREEGLSPKAVRAKLAPLPPLIAALQTV
ncbi:tRNA glutamyl-Q(34) synthetase GluQRS [Beijerinckia indica]|uniref:Glutamyl-tRNA synthetase class Ic n=1 Tax=Beijerinckia indica subsp. indica (strain ATCC 9039 / DSM 1715 / NCIMB 8712) TaxID=395963 RepID=B2IE62_BEII9|nr:tRNA glutamyl-Q(34) synthetase GluQRS [Beijerinckia indica]ACB94086.1 glutamyl-tRNA synthetase class Ic [Beijerinckia indica subsp. indica ATCC 9039]